VYEPLSVMISVGCTLASWAASRPTDALLDIERHPRSPAGLALTAR
jgi:hypothetical protein